MRIFTTKINENFKDKEKTGDHQNSFLQLPAMYQVENLEERDFQIFQIEAVKLLSGIQGGAEDRNL